MFRLAALAWIVCLIVSGIGAQAGAALPLSMAD